MGSSPTFTKQKYLLELFFIIQSCYLVLQSCRKLLGRSYYLRNYAHVWCVRTCGFNKTCYLLCCDSLPCPSPCPSGPHFTTHTTYYDTHPYMCTGGLIKQTISPEKSQEFKNEIFLLYSTSD